MSKLVEYQYMNHILDNMYDLIAAMDDKFDFTYFNNSYRTEFKKIFGEDIAVGDNIIRKLEKLPDEQRKAKEIWERALQGEEFIVIQEFGDESTQINTYEISYSNVKDSENNVIGASHIVKNVTIREHFRRKSEEASKIKTKFLSNMSHELRTPLNSIIGFAQLLQINKVQSNTLKYSKIILRSSNYLLGLINDTLDINAIEQGFITFSFETINVNNVLEELMEDMNMLASENNITLNVQLCDDINILADRRRFKQILINLISNAIKYNVPNGFVNITKTTSGNILNIHITDSGIGISPENLNKIGTMFDRFGQTSAITGTGLGLAIVKMLCTNMNGTFDVTSEINKGSTFSVGFNISNESCSDIYSGNNKQISDVTCDYNGFIYYVDDNEFNLLLMEQIVKTYMPNAKYEHERNSERAYTTIFQKRPDLILLDINMSPIDGLTILNAIKNNKILETTKIFMLSADVTNNVERKCLGFGANAYLSKPINVTNLLSSINEHCMQPK
jgi:signal transduction histidine kinase/CheY-like chemotaxis protein